MTDSQLYLVVETAYRMVECGAEIYRVEESIIRMCTAYGCVRVHAYATPSNIIVSAENSQGDVLTQTRRVRQSTTDIERLHALNSLVRSVCEGKADEALFRSRLYSIGHTKRYSAFLEIIFYGVIAASFCIFFGGREINEIIFSLFIGVAVGCAAKLLEKTNSNKMLARFICSSLACICTFALQKGGLIATAHNVIIGNIMSLIPGIGLTNALRDLFTGDTVTGILRSIEAVLLALAIALGYIVAGFLFGGLYI